MKRLHLISGISSKGKNRILEHGHMWYEDLGSPAAPGRRCRLTAVSTGYVRWLDHSDKDFRIDKTWDINQKGEEPPK